MSFVTFIIPTVGRDTISRTLKSIVDQTDPDWNALVIGDGLGGNWRCPWHDCKIWTSVIYPKVGFSNAGALMRNHGMSFANGEWIAFVDDDDRISEYYVQWLREECAYYDLVIFKMITSDGTCLPPTQELGPGLVGISFSIRSAFQKEKGIFFSPSGGEDWDFIEKARGCGARTKVSEHIAYYIRH